MMGTSAFRGKGGVMLYKKIEELTAKLHVLIGSKDTEAAHGEADKILCEILVLLGQHKAVKFFRRINKWYS